MKKMTVLEGIASTIAVGLMVFASLFCLLGQ